MASAAQETEKGKFYIGHIVHPLFRDGLRTLAYELVEQLGWKPPSIVYLPVSAGTLLLSVIDGFRHLEKSGLVRVFRELSLVKQDKYHHYIIASKAQRTFHLKT